MRESRGAASSPGQQELWVQGKEGEKTGLRREIVTTSYSAYLVPPRKRIKDGHTDVILAPSWVIGADSLDVSVFYRAVLTCRTAPCLSRSQPCRVLQCPRAQTGTFRSRVCQRGLLARAFHSCPIEVIRSSLSVSCLLLVGYQFKNICLLPGDSVPGASADHL